MSSRQLLEKLEAEDKYVFHGSENPGLKFLEPRQAYTIVNRLKENDDKPAVHASSNIDIAIFMGMINQKIVLKDLTLGLPITKIN